MWHHEPLVIMIMTIIYFILCGDRKWLDGYLFIIISYFNFNFLFFIFFYHGRTFCSGEQQAAQKHSSLYPTSSALIGRVAGEHGAALSKPSAGHFFWEVH